MKLGYKLMLFGLVAMVAMPFFMLKPDGTRMMSPADLLPDSSTFSGAREAINNQLGKEDSAGFAKNGSGESLHGSGKMYSWRDAKGQMHFSEHPPEDASSAAVAALPQGVNLMQAVEVPSSAESGSAGAQGGSGGNGFKLAFPTTIPVQDIPKLVDDAKGLQALADKRNAAASEL